MVSAYRWTKSLVNADSQIPLHVEHIPLISHRLVRNAKAGDAHCRNGAWPHRSGACALGEGGRYPRNGTTCSHNTHGQAARFGRAGNCRSMTVAPPARPTAPQAMAPGSDPGWLQAVQGGWLVRPEDLELGRGTIGRGSVGDVYKGTHVPSGRIVAVKVSSCPPGRLPSLREKRDAMRRCSLETCDAADP